MHPSAAVAATMPKTSPKPKFDEEAFDFQFYHPRVEKFSGLVLNGLYHNKLTHSKPSMQIPDNYFGIAHGRNPEDDSRAYWGRPLSHWDPDAKTWAPGLWLPEQMVPIIRPTGAPKIFH
jgi:hypothetical protein